MLLPMPISDTFLNYEAQKLTCAVNAWHWRNAMHAITTQRHFFSLHIDEQVYFVVLQVGHSIWLYHRFFISGRNLTTLFSMSRVRNKLSRVRYTFAHLGQFRDFLERWLSYIIVIYANYSPLPEL